MKIVKEKSFYRSILTIALPIAMQNFITFANSMLDSIMLGRADTTGVLLSASTLANQPFFILSMICFGLSGGATVLSAQYWGKGDTAAIRRIFAMILQLAAAVSMLLGLAVLIFPEQILSLYSNQPDIIAAGAEYLRIMGFAYVLFGTSNTLICAIRSVELVRISVVVNTLSCLTNAFLNWVLIFGNLGAPALGIQGAALASLAARVLEFLVVFGYIFLIDRRLAFRPRHLFRFDKVLFRDLVSNGTPVLCNEVMWSLGTTLQASLLGHIEYASGDPVAANSIASMVQQLSTIVIFGIANAAAVLVGKPIGEGNKKEAELRAHTLRYLSYLVGLIACGAILLLRNVAVNFYSIPQESKDLAVELMTTVAFITFFVSISATSIVGILRGAGDTRFCLISEMVALWCVALPAAFVAAYLFQWPVPIVLLCMKLDEPLKSLMCIVRMRTGKWIRSVTRDFGSSAKNA